MYRLLALVIFLSACSQHKNNTIQRLKLIKAFEVETYGGLEPSGLTLWDDKFYTVSDKHDKIYQLDFISNKVTLKPIIEIINNRDTKIDFEGITHDDENFYLVSEKYFQILKVSKDGTQQTWLTEPDVLKQAGEQVGLFKTHNANFEGLCVLGNGNFLLAAERQPRGFIEYNNNDKSVKAYQMDSPVFEYEGNRSPDFTGLSCDDDIYVLDRNADTIGKLERNKGQYQETTGYSYKNIINQKNFQYQDMKYGQAEGLVVKDNTFYIILDNNRSHLKNNQTNNNSLFLQLEVR